MGFNTNGIKCLLLAKQSGVCFMKTMTIGRQRLYLDSGSLKETFRLFHISVSDAEIERILSENDGYVESFLRMLGAVEIVSMDAAQYERATYIHDMNQPIPEQLKNTFSVVIDSGSLEHIFDFPRAIKNCMEMVQVGGHFISITIAIHSDLNNCA